MQEGIPTTRRLLQPSFFAVVLVQVPPFCTRLVVMNFCGTQAFSFLYLQCVILRGSVGLMCSFFRGNLWMNLSSITSSPPPLQKINDWALFIESRVGRIQLADLDDNSVKFCSRKWPFTPDFVRFPWGIGDALREKKILYRHFVHLLSFCAL